MTRTVRKKYRKNRLASWAYLFFWIGAGAAGSLLILLSSSYTGTRITFGILTALVFSFLIMSAKYKFKPALYSLMGCAAGQILCSACLNFHSIPVVVLSCTLIMILSYPCWFWIVSPEWEQTAARWALYFILLVTGYFGAPQHRMLYILILLMLIGAVHLYIDGDLNIIKTSPRNRRKAQSAATSAHEVASMQALMLDRAKRMARRRAAQELVDRSAEKQDAKKTQVHPASIPQGSKSGS